MKKLSLLVACIMFAQFAFAQNQIVTSNRDGSCPPPENLEGMYYWEDYEFGARLAWDRAEYTSDLNRFEVYRKTDGTEYEMIKRIVNVPYMSHYEALDILEEAGNYYYKIIAFYQDGCESDPVEIIVNVTSVDENEIENVSIYPNPTSGIITVKAEQMKKIEIINSLGQVVMIQNIDTEEVTIDMNSFESGVYFVNIVTDQGNIVRKVNVK